jgi:hypothetical protein
VGAKTKISPGSPDARKLVRQLVETIDDPARAIELYYWSREDDLCQIMRGVIAMRPQTRAALRGFLAMSRKPEEIQATFDELGRMIFSSDEVTDMLQTSKPGAKRHGQGPQD